ncbi:hypothetical protein TWF718_010506 [Orbilia javanica]|uniref:Uncharacterized protein n=1 Tax=Orbilia javanica TaxID=47235 RepID=A0AAN8NPS3_9PEZI
MRVKWNGCFIATGILLSGFGTKISVGAVPDQDGYDTVLWQAIDDYERAYLVPIKHAVLELFRLEDGYKKRYRFGLSRDEFERENQVQQKQNTWEEKNLPRTEPWLEPFEVLQPYSFTELSTTLLYELAILLTKVKNTKNLQPSDPSISIETPDPYEDPISQRLSYLTEPKNIPLSGTLPLYTESGRNETFNTLVEFVNFVDGLPGMKADLAPMFYSYQRRSVEIRNVSVIGVLASFMEAQAGGRDTMLDTHSGYPIDKDESGGVRIFIEHLYAIPDDPEYTDRSVSEDLDQEYIQVLPARYEFKPAGKADLELGLSLLADAVTSLTDSFGDIIGRTFQRGIPRDHPAVINAWEASKELYQFLKFYADGLSAFSEAMQQFPALTTNWVEPNHEQVKWLRKQPWYLKLVRQGKNDDYFEQNPEFFKDFKVPSIELEDEGQSNILEEEEESEYPSQSEPRSGTEDDEQDDMLEEEEDSENGSEDGSQGGMSEEELEFGNIQNPSQSRYQSRIGIDDELMFDELPVIDPSQKQQVNEIDPLTFNPTDLDLLQFGNPDANEDTYLEDPFAHHLGFGNRYGNMGGNLESDLFTDLDLGNGPQNIGGGFEWDPTLPEPDFGNPPPGWNSENFDQY